MKVALVAFGLFALSGCVRASEGIVRDKASNDFACADYALTVVEVGPDVFRAQGCGQELIYACRPTKPADHPDHDGGLPLRPSASAAGPHAPGADDFGDEAVMVCARTANF